MTSPRRPWYRRPGRVIPLGLLAAGAVFAVVAVASPWPSALLIRGLFEIDARKAVEEMAPFVPTSGIDAHLDLAYGDGPNEEFDLFTPQDAGRPLPTVVWIHGGAWISGSKENVAPYLQIIASHGYATVGLDYTVSPEAKYPTAVNQLNDALAHLIDNADEYGIDSSQIVLAGDSAGANLASQLAVIATNPAYAEQMQITPAITPQQLRAVVLDCGIYDVSGIPNAPGLGGWGFRVALWSYFGERDWAQTAGGDEMSTLDFVTADFPRTWISGGNADPLTDGQTVPLIAALTDLGVDVTPVLYASDHTPALPHEYQFHLDLQDAQNALQSTLDFLADLR